VAKESKKLTGNRGPSAGNGSRGRSDRGGPNGNRRKSGQPEGAGPIAAAPRSRYWALAWEFTKLALDAQAVVAARILEATSGRMTTGEAERMIWEKIIATARAQLAALSTSELDLAAARVTRVFARSVAANRRRLAG